MNGSNRYVWGTIGVLVTMVPVLIAEIIAGGNDVEHLTLILGFMGVALGQVITLSTANKTHTIMRDMEQKLNGKHVSVTDDSDMTGQ